MTKTITEDNTSKGFWHQLGDNVLHTIPQAFYVGLGAATQQAMPVIGKINPVIPMVFYGSNIYARWDESAKILGNKHEIAVQHHKILADYFVNAGMSFVSAIFFATNPVAATAAVGTFLVTEIAIRGDNSPVDLLKANLAGVLDSVFGDNL